jgi:hypothetical protein
MAKIENSLTSGDNIPHPTLDAVKQDDFIDALAHLFGQSGHNK